MEQTDLEILLIEELRDRGEGTAPQLRARLNKQRGIVVEGIALIYQALHQLEKERHATSRDGQSPAPEEVIYQLRRESAVELDDQDTET